MQEYIYICSITKQYKMANFYHNSLNEEQSNELRLRMEKAKSDTFQVYELAKTFKTLWRWKAHNLYQEIYKTTIQSETIGRALNDLCAMGYLIDTGNREKSGKGSGSNIVYRVCDVEPVDPIKIPKSISTKLSFIDREDGSPKLDWDSMLEEFISKFDYYDKVFSQIEPKVELPTNENELELYIHEMIVKANDNLKPCIGAVVGRYLALLREEGVLESFDYKRDEDDRLKTIIKVTEPTQIPTVRQRLNQLYLQEKRRSKQTN